MTLSFNSDFAKLCLGIPHNIEHVSELLFDLTYPGEGTVPPRGAGTVLVAACPMLLLTNTVSGAGTCFTSSRLNFASNHWQSLQ